MELPRPTLWLLPGYRTIIRLVKPTRLERYAAVQACHRFLIRRMLPESIVIHGLQFFLDDTDSMHLTTQARQPFTLRFVLEQTHLGDVVLDIGAHIGSFALPLSQRVGESGRVFAFEPDPTNHAILRRSVAVNGIRNINTEQAAVSDRAGSLTLYQSTGCSALHRTHPSPLCRQAIVVTTISLDDYFGARPSHVDLVKIDVEGAELNVLRGMQKLISANPRLRILMEFVPAWIHEAGHRVDEVVDFMRDNGFLLFELDEQNEMITPANIADLVRRYPPKSNWGTNLWCIPRNQAPFAMTALRIP